MSDKPITDDHEALLRIAEGEKAGDKALEQLYRQRDRMTVPDSADLSLLIEGPRWRTNNRHNACCPGGASEPATHKVGIESMSKRHAGHRSARLLAGHDHLTLEFRRMGSAGCASLECFARCPLVCLVDTILTIQH